MMDSYEKLIHRIAHTISSGANIMDNERQAVVDYGVNVFISAFITTILLIVLSIALTATEAILTVAFTAATLRAFSGGHHNRTLLGCTLFTLIVFPFLGLVIKNIAIPIVITKINCVAIFIISFYIILKKAPLDSAEKPIESLLQQNFLKKASLCFITIIFIVQLLTLRFLANDHTFVLALSIGMLWQSLQLTVIGKTFISLFDSLLQLIRRKGENFNENV